MMPRLVTGVYYEQGDAERAVAALQAQGIPPEEIYLEREVSAGPEAGWKGGEVSRIEQERRVAGRETGVMMGLTFGVLSGLGISVLGRALYEWISRMPEAGPMTMPMLLASPCLAALTGALIGVIVGVLIGWVVDITLTRRGAGPPLPAHEALVTVRTDEGHVSQVRAALFGTRARHLHVADRPTV
jgi:F0F1-type ATP synthase membrane subunit c/vacuolar-type H+-ATPase subunit K